MGVHLLGVQVRAPAAGGIPLIAIWSGSIGSIPAGFHLCDGGAGTPDLRDSFVQMDSVLAVSGQTGSGVYSVSHNHPATVPVVDTEAGPLHVHTLVAGDAKSAGGDWESLTGSALATGGTVHTHLLASGTFLDTATHDHFVQGAPAAVNLLIDPRPPFYALAYIKALAPVVLPVGAVALWDDNIDSPPSGYFVCNGHNGTPDLRGFIAQGVGGGLGLLAHSIDVPFSVNHGHSSAYTANTATHQHDYAGPLFPSTDQYFNATSNFVTTGPPTGITADGHLHDMELHTDLAGDHPHTMTFDLPAQTIAFGDPPITSRVVALMRVR